MIFLCYPKCSTCMKAQRWLDGNNIKYEFRDIKTNNPNAIEIEKWLKISKLPLKKFFNTSGLLYKKYELKEKLPSMSESEQIKLLATEGMLVKRPMLIDDNFVLIGFKQEEWEKQLIR